MHLTEAVKTIAPPDRAVVYNTERPHCKPPDQAAKMLLRDLFIMAAQVALIEGRRHHKGRKIAHPGSGVKVALAAKSSVPLLDLIMSELMDDASLVVEPDSYNAETTTTSTTSRRHTKTSTTTDDSCTAATVCVDWATCSIRGGAYVNAISQPTTVIQANCPTGATIGTIVMAAHHLMSCPAVPLRLPLLPHRQPLSEPLT